jgi:hypothetical protein
VATVAETLQRAELQHLAIVGTLVEASFLAGRASGIDTTRNVVEVDRPPSSEVPVARSTRTIVRVTETVVPPTRTTGRDLFDGIAGGTRPCDVQRGCSVLERIRPPDRNPFAALRIPETVANRSLRHGAAVGDVHLRRRRR